MPSLTSIIHDMEAKQAEFTHAPDDYVTPDPDFDEPRKRRRFPQTRRGNNYTEQGRRLGRESQQRDAYWRRMHVAKLRRGHRQREIVEILNGGFYNFKCSLRTIERDVAFILANPDEFEL